MQRLAPSAGAGRFAFQALRKMIQLRRQPCPGSGRAAHWTEQPPFGGDNIIKREERVHETRQFCKTACWRRRWSSLQPSSFAQTKVTNQGISPTEDRRRKPHAIFSGPVKVWGVPVSNGMKMAVDEINAAGGIHGRKIKLIVEDTGYDPKKAVLATQKLIEKDKIFVDGRRRWDRRPVLAAQDLVLEAGDHSTVSADRCRIHVQVRSGQAAGATEVQQPAALHRKHTRRR